MENQTIIHGFDREIKSEEIKTFIQKKEVISKNHLENEKKNFIEVISWIIDNLNLEKSNETGRPSFHLKDILKSLLVMSYNGISFRRSESDLADLKEKGIIKYIPKKSVLCKYMKKEEVTKVLERLIQISSFFFMGEEDTIILDSTWLGTKMYSGGHRSVYKKDGASLTKVRKVHISILQNSRIISCAKATEGTLHDTKMFEHLVLTTTKNGFKISRLIADSGYNSKDNYAFCESLNIRKAFIDFRSNSKLRRAKSFAWKRQLKMFKENPKEWHENYRFRVIVEGVFSSIKRKHTNFLRTKLAFSQDNELLLKCLVHNFCIIGKYI